MLGLALPCRCIHCGQPVAQSGAGRRTLGAYLCTVCLRVLEAELAIEERDVRHTLYRTAPNIDFEHCTSLHRFNATAPIRSVVHSAKYDGMMRLARLLGEQFSHSGDNEPFDYIVPVPLHRTRMAERGYNQSTEIARGLNARLVLPNAVRRTRATPTQTSLHVEERIENVRGAFALTRHAAKIAGKRILIIDDVMTTGATIASVAETLLAANPASVSLATVAIAVEASQPTK